MTKISWLLFTYDHIIELYVGGLHLKRTIWEPLRQIGKSSLSLRGFAPIYSALCLEAKFQVPSRPSPETTVVPTSHRALQGNSTTCRFFRTSACCYLFQPAGLLVMRSLKWFGRRQAFFSCLSWAFSHKLNTLRSLYTATAVHNRKPTKVRQLTRW